MSERTPALSSAMLLLLRLQAIAIFYPRPFKVQCHFNPYDRVTSIKGLSLTLQSARANLLLTFHDESGDGAAVDLIAAFIDGPSEEVVVERRFRFRDGSIAEWLEQRDGFSHTEYALAQSLAEMLQDAPTPNTRPPTNFS